MANTTRFVLNRTAYRNRTLVSSLNFEFGSHTGFQPSCILLLFE